MESQTHCNFCQTKMSEIILEHRSLLKLLTKEGTVCIVCLKNKQLIDFAIGESHSVLRQDFAVGLYEQYYRKETQGLQNNHIICICRRNSWNKI
jgi:uncharacterized protein (DUF2344 family)